MESNTPATGQSGDLTTLDRPQFLAPGFIASIFGNGIVVFPQHSGQAARRAHRGTLSLVAALSTGDPRPVREVVDDVVAATGADREVLARFVESLVAFGTSSPEPAPDRFSHLTPPATPPVSLAGDTRFTLVRPAGLLVEAGRFLWFDHDGTLLARFSVAELLAATTFGAPRTVDAAFAAHPTSDQARGVDQLPRAEFDRLAATLVHVGLLRVVSEAELALLTPPAAGAAPAKPDPRLIVQERVAATVEAHQREAARHPGHRTPVVPVNFDHGIAPLSLALLVAHARDHDGGRLDERYDFVPEYLTDEERIIERAEAASIFLFSNYVWTVDRNLRLSALVKQVNPDSITVHGGPSTPKYPADTEAFFHEHPHVDVAVHGEGEATFTEMLDVLDGAVPMPPDALHGVAGLTYRAPGGGVVRTEGRDRIADLDTIPSPYRLGLLDAFGAAQAGAILETNRGCPYGCTFCDWGSSTLSRIRKFDIERVFDELEWSASHKIDITSIADANFGIFERDVDIAEKIAELKRRYGYPRTVATNYAKNTVKHLRKIIEIFADVEILTEGVVSLQSMDAPTLKIIRRSNIKLEKYNEMSSEFRRARLPLAADIMMGLPGSTPISFRSDLQSCSDRDVRVRANPTQLLPNSPMNDPEYRAEHGIVAKPGEIVRETATYTRAEWDDMDSLRRAFYIFDNWGVLRYVSRHVRRETGVKEVELHDRVRSDVAADPARWPAIAGVLQILESYMAPPASWGLFVEEIRRYVTTELGVADDSALRTALVVQLAHLPAPNRRFPETIALEHDYAAWQEAVLTARESGHRDDWETVVPALAEFGPAELVISDPNDICGTDVGRPMGMLAMSLRSWELDSPVARPRLGVTSGV